MDELGDGFVLAVGKVEAIANGFFRLLPNLVIGLLFFLFILVAARVIKYAIRHGAARRGREDLGNVLGTLVQWIVGIFGFLIAVTIIVPGVGVSDLLTTLGISSVAIGFAFKDILQNLLAGVLILLRRPFRRGDQIVAGNFEGTVERIQTRATVIRTYDGRQVLIPNSVIYTSSVTINTAFDVRRSEYDVGIGYGDEIPAAVRTIREALREVEGVLPDPPPEAFVSDLAPAQVMIRVWWWTGPKQMDVLRTRGRVLATIREALAREAIDIPFPTTTILFHDQTEETDGRRDRQREGWPAGSSIPEPSRIARARKPPR
ncbi:MAG: mechanosensitive ion channel family protein [Alphaproteobacteria bacterium]|nr:mechanosensitive ion channel family protein [Alphaproteobacteria bacterium]